MDIKLAERGKKESSLSLLYLFTWIVKIVHSFGRHSDGKYI